MKECVTEALVLNAEAAGEHDRTVHLFSKDLGLVEARVVAGRKILSRLQPHLPILGYSLVRLVNKNRFTVTDAILLRSWERTDPDFLGRALELAYGLIRLLPRGAADPLLWEMTLEQLRSGAIDYPAVLKIAGYDNNFASCERCRAKLHLNFFSLEDHCFLCRDCSTAILRPALWQIG